MIFIGIDPGGSGAVAAVDDIGRPYDSGKGWHVKNKSTPHDIASWIRDLNYETIDGVRAVIEKVSSMPNQVVSSTFKFGHSAGMLEGFLVSMQISYSLVSPLKWQKKIGCNWPSSKPKPTQAEKKNLNKTIAQRKWPDYELTHATADALMLAEYCRLMFLDQRIEPLDSK